MSPAPAPEPEPEPEPEPAILTGFRVTLEPAGWQFTADPHRPLLASAKAAGLGLPAMCRNGTCRVCLCRARAGAVVYRIEWPGLFAEEKAEGWILPCVAHPASDLTLEQPQAVRFGGG